MKILCGFDSQRLPLTTVFIRSPFFSGWGSLFSPAPMNPVVLRSVKTILDRVRDGVCYNRANNYDKRSEKQLT